jgi:hypothetical protein
MIVAASFVVMTSSIRLYKADDSVCNEGSSSADCQRVKYALSLGAIGIVFGIVEIVLSNRGQISTYPEAGLTFMLFALYIAGISLITFSFTEGPGTNIGNLYFSTWAGFILAMFLTSKSWTAVKAQMKGDNAEEEGAKDEAKAEEGAASDNIKADDAPPEAPVDVTSGDA